MILQNNTGRVVFWFLWPGLWLGLRFTTRTRALIEYNNQVLVVKSWLGNGKWNLPGGGIKAEEDMLTAVIREVKEETAITLKPNNCKKIVNLEYKSSGLRFKYLLYKIEFKEKPKICKPQKEIIVIDWVEKSQLNRQIANSDVIDALKFS